VSQNQSEQQPNEQPNAPYTGERIAGRWVFDLIEGGSLYLTSRFDDNQILLDVHEVLELLDYLYQNKDQLLKTANEIGNDESELPEWIDEVF
jgi:hypothetical protein